MVLVGARTDSAIASVQRHGQIALVRQSATTVLSWTAKLVDVRVLTDGPAQTVQSVVRTDTILAIPAGLRQCVTITKLVVW